MRFTNLISPVTSSNRNDWQLCQDNGTSDCRGNLFWALHPKAHMTTMVTDGNKGLKSSSLSSPGLFLHRHDLKNFIFKSGAKEKINYLKFLEREERN